MLVQEALEAAGLTGANLQQVLGALETCDFAPEMPADAAFTNFDLSRHLVHCPRVCTATLLLLSSKLQAKVRFTPSSS